MYVKSLLTISWLVVKRPQNRMEKIFQATKYFVFWTLLDNCRQIQKTNGIYCGAYWYSARKKISDLNQKVLPSAIFFSERRWDLHTTTRMHFFRLLSRRDDNSAALSQRARACCSDELKLHTRLHLSCKNAAMYLLRLEIKSALIFFLLHASNNIACHQQHSS